MPCFFPPIFFSTLWVNLAPDTLSSTRATVESQFCGGVKLLNEELREWDLVICLQRVVPFLPVQHQIVVGVRIYRCKETGKEIVQKDKLRTSLKLSVWGKCGWGNVRRSFQVNKYHAFTIWRTEFEQYIFFSAFRRTWPGRDVARERDRLKDSNKV